MRAAHKGELQLWQKWEILRSWFSSLWWDTMGRL